MEQQLTSGCCAYEESGSAMRAVQRPSIASLISRLAIETFSNPIN
jgi:hypothetical protein